VPNLAVMYNNTAISQLFDFGDGGRPPSWNCGACVWIIHEGHLVVFITVQNLVGTGIDAIVLINMHVFYFASLAWKRLFTPQN